MNIDSTLPPPGKDAQAHSARVLAHGRDEIARCGGCSPFSRYRALVLYAPDLRVPAT